MCGVVWRMLSWIVGCCLRCVVVRGVVCVVLSGICFLFCVVYCMCCLFVLLRVACVVCCLCCLCRMDGGYYLWCMCYLYRMGDEDYKDWIGGWKFCKYVRPGSGKNNMKDFWGRYIVERISWFFLGMVCRIDLVYRIFIIFLVYIFSYHELFGGLIYRNI